MWSGVVVLNGLNFCMFMPVFLLLFIFPFKTWSSVCQTGFFAAVYSRMLENPDPSLTAASASIGCSMGARLSDLETGFDWCRCALGKGQKTPK